MAVETGKQAVAPDKASDSKRDARDGNSRAAATGPAPSSPAAETGASAVKAAPKKPPAKKAAPKKAAPKKAAPKKAAAKKAAPKKAAAKPAAKKVASPAKKADPPNAEAKREKAKRKGEKKPKKKGDKQKAKKAKLLGLGLPVPVPSSPPIYTKKGRLNRDYYEEELERLQTELVKYQYWVKDKGLRVVVLFEGRDAAGKGGAIKRISECLNPRGCRVVALGTPTERERSQWYFQRYVPHLPAAGEIVMFDRSWYNRAGVERVMGFCTKHQYREFLRSCPEFERMLVRAGMVLIKYWFSVSDEEQERRFRSRASTPAKRWKLSPMDLESRTRWVEYSKAKDVMFEHTDLREARWNVVNSNDKRGARLNCISHFLSTITYKDVLPKDTISFPPRQENVDYERPPLEEQNFVPNIY